MKLYSAMLNIEGRLAVVIGGGVIAYRKCADLIDAGAKVKLVSPKVCDEINSLAEATGRISVHVREYREGDLEDACLAVSATDSPDVNRRVFEEADAANIFVNAVDDPPNCSFIVPSTIKRGDLIVSVSTSGASPTMAARIRKSIEEVIPDDIEETLRAFRTARDMLKSEPEFSALDFNARGAVIKQISADMEQIEELKFRYTAGTLKDYLKRFL
jgi:precorrin-2 dehydrogenase/sirohydrochlorin ferrochelatase